MCLWQRGMGRECVTERFVANSLNLNFHLSSVTIIPQYPLSLSLSLSILLSLYPSLSILLSLSFSLSLSLSLSISLSLSEFGSFHFSLLFISSLLQLQLELFAKTNSTFSIFPFFLYITLFLHASFTPM